MTMSPSEKYQKAEALKGRAREARKLLDEIRTAAQESKDGENAVTAGRRLEQIHGWAGEARDHLAILTEASVEDVLAGWEFVK